MDRPTLVAAIETAQLNRAGAMTDAQTAFSRGDWPQAVHYITDAARWDSRAKALIEVMASESEGA